MARYVYPAVIEGDARSGWGLAFPDLPGCVTVGDTMTELLHNAKEALTLHIEGLTADGVSLPPATPLELIPLDPEFVEARRTLIVVEPEEQAVKVSVSLPLGLLKRVDNAADARGLSRSAFLAESAKTLLKAG